MINFLKKYKKEFIVVLLIIIALLVFIGIYTKEDSNPISNTTIDSKSFTVDKTYDNYLFTNIGTRIIKDRYHVLITVKNTGNEKLESQSVKIRFVNSKGKKIEDKTILIPSIENGSDVDLDLIVKEKVYKASDFKILGIESTK